MKTYQKIIWLSLFMKEAILIKGLEPTLILESSSREKIPTKLRRLNLVKSYETKI